jgi:hypothetical protein
MCDVPVDVGQDIEQFGNADLVPGLAGVLPHRCDDFIGVSLHGRLQLPQLLLPLVGSRRLRLPLVRPLQ